MCNGETMACPSREADLGGGVHSVHVAEVSIERRPRAERLLAQIAHFGAGGTASEFRNNGSSLAILLALKII